MIAQTTAFGETFLTIPGEAILIASKSQPGTWHKTTTKTCDCKSFEFRSRCRHIDAVNAVAAEAIQQYGQVDEQAERRARIAAANAEIWD